jgi:hypothetical protein
MGESTNADSYHELPLYAAIHTLKPQTFLVNQPMLIRIMNCPFMQQSTRSSRKLFW